VGGARRTRKRFAVKKEGAFNKKPGLTALPAQPTNEQHKSDVVVVVQVVERIVALLLHDPEEVVEHNIPCGEEGECWGDKERVGREW
jgi:hypothetical protein